VVGTSGAVVACAGLVREDVNPMETTNGGLCETRRVGDEDRVREVSALVLIDRMMRCGARWHYGLSGRDKAVYRRQFSGNQRLRRGVVSGREEKERRKKEGGARSQIDYGTLRLTLRG
jgi:hypothetical protein